MKKQTDSEGNNNIRVVKGLPNGEVSPVLYSVREEKDILTPMRDGTCLAMDLLLPEVDGPSPVILIRTPYDKVISRDIPLVRDLAMRGYVIAIQDCRGRFNSDGDFSPYQQEHDDGFDSVEWIAAQCWCSGKVAMMGASYEGQTQWYAASQAPPSLKAIVPTASPPGHPFLNEPFYGGPMILAMAEWMVAMGRRSFQSPGLKGLMTQHQDYFNALPLSKLGSLAGTNSSWWEEIWLNHPHYDDFWESCGYEQFWPNMTVPALNLTGWWDMNFIGAPRNFVGMRNQGATIDAREGQRLVIGPWEHWINQSRILSGQDFGANGIVNLNNYILRFFDYWLKGNNENKLDQDLPVHIFVVGANQWWEADNWPLPGTFFKNFYLHSKGNANSHRGDGVISSIKPGNEPDDIFISDPYDPVVFPWSLHEGPVDDRQASARSDVLCYTSEILADNIDVVGPVRAVLYASSSALDCEWHIRLVDVYPDGSTRFLCHGALRARFRDGFSCTTLLTPGQITRFDIDMTAIGIRFLVGHRIRVEIASSWFPRFDRNLQTGVNNWMRDETDPVVAHQLVRHNQVHPSHVVLPARRYSPE